MEWRTGENTRVKKTEKNRRKENMNTNEESNNLTTEV